MAYTNDRVAGFVRDLDSRLARIEQAQAAILAGMGTPVAAPVTLAAASPTVIPEQGTPKARTACTLHADKVFAVTPAGSATGSGFHFGWCKGAPQAVATA